MQINFTLRDLFWLFYTKSDPAQKCKHTTCLLILDTLRLWLSHKRIYFSCKGLKIIRFLSFLEVPFITKFGIKKLIFWNTKICYVCWELKLLRAVTKKNWMIHSDIYFYFWWPYFLADKFYPQGLIWCFYSRDAQGISNCNNRNIFLPGTSGGMTNLWLRPVKGEVGHLQTLQRYPVPQPEYRRQEEQNRIGLKKLLMTDKSNNNHCFFAVFFLNGSCTEQNERRYLTLKKQLHTYVLESLHALYLLSWTTRLAGSIQPPVHRDQDVKLDTVWVCHDEDIIFYL